MFQAFRTTAVTIQRLFNDYDSAIQSQDMAQTLDQYPPVFIVGSPRTGSTLLYQLLLSQFRLSYISNTMALLPMHMIKLARLYPKAASGFIGAYKENTYGYVPGMFSPNEAGKILNKWFKDIKQNQHHEDVRNTVRALSLITQSPFVIKNLQQLTVNIPILNDIFPQARYIITERDPRFTAQSMLIARRRFMGNDKQWWNIKPDGYESVLNKDPIYQVLWQVMKLHQIAKSDLQELIEVGQACIVNYEDLCADPLVTLNALHTQFNLEWRKDRETLDRFSPSTGVVLNEEWERIEAFYQELSEQFQTS